MHSVKVQITAHTHSLNHNLRAAGPKAGPGLPGDSSWFLKLADAAEGLRIEFIRFTPENAGNSITN